LVVSEAAGAPFGTVGLMATTVNGRVLDWERRFSPRSLEYKVSTTTSVLTKRNVSYKRRLWLNQFNEGACTGFGFSHALGTGFRRPKYTIDNAFAKQRYYRARQFDQWAGENYEGSSVLGAMEGGKADKLIKAYYWCTTMAELDFAISWMGPVDIGVDWYGDMFYPDEKGFIHVSGNLEGGHSLEIGARNNALGYRLDNSWGPDWGQDGSCWISFADMEKLLHSRGEFAVMRKFKP
jgi:hypothetical protein